MAVLMRIIKDRYRTGAIIAFLCYVSSVLFITILFRRFEQVVSVQVNPFRKYIYLAKSIIVDVRDLGYLGVIRFFIYKETTITEVLLNVLLFIPLGYLVPMLHERFDHLWRILLIGILLSLLIETIQYATHRGYFDSSDILHNTIGTGVGYLIYKKWIGPPKKNRKLT